jgi:hypothetical protein
VLVSSDGKEVDPKYLKIVKPEALIVVAPISQPRMPQIAPVPGRPTLPLPAPVPVPQPPAP